MIDQALLDFGVLGIVAIIAGYIIKRLYDDNQRLNSEIRQIQDNANDRFIALITTITEQQERTHIAVEKIVESLAVQEYVAKKLEQLQHQQQQRQTRADQDRQGSD